MSQDQVASTGLPGGAPVRKRLRRREVYLGTRFLTCSCYRRLALFERDEVKDEFVRVLGAARERHRFRLLAWVLMPEHFHLLIVPTAGRGGSAVPAVLIGVKKALSDRVLRGWRAEGAPVLGTIRDGRGKERFWQAGGGFDRNVRDEDEYARTVWYIHQNPVKRGLVREPTEWKWSSARWYAGEREGVLAIDDDDFRHEETRSS